MSAFNIPSAISKSAITPSFIGRTAWILRGVLPSIALALWPTASTSLVVESTATTEGSARTIPFASDIDECIRCSQVDADVAGKQTRELAAFIDER